MFEKKKKNCGRIFKMYFLREETIFLKKPFEIYFMREQV